MTFLPDASTMLTYSLACFILFITPGPDMSLFLARTMQGGRKAGIASMVGSCTGCLGHSLAAAFGLSALIAASATAFGALKILGALYLLWMAYSAIRYGSTLNLKNAEAAPPALAATFWQGVGINLTNPKVVLFFITFLPQFIRADDPDASAKLFFLGVYMVAFTFPFAILMILIAERFVGFLKSNPRAMRVIDYAFAGVFGFFAAQVLRTQTR
ncbi:MAG: LysE family translocator [Proteobacteria bacterium]|nr:LysE family translocator [Pseudomonadota bacterium]